MNTLHDALSRDQCEHGFQHTEDVILNWLCDCTDDAVESLQRRIAEHLADLRSIRAKQFREGMGR